MASTLTEALLFLSLSLFLWTFFRRIASRRPFANIDGPPSRSLFGGIFSEFFTGDGLRTHENLLKKYGSVVKVQGLFGKTMLYVSDPKAIYNIIIKDQYIYEETADFFMINQLVFGPGLLSTQGDHHKKQRKLLNPVFSIVHMREMIPTFYEIAHKLEAALASRAKDGAHEIDVLSWLTRTALELVAQCGLGCSFDTLTKDNEKHPYAVATQQLIPASIKTFVPRSYILPWASKIGTPRFRRTIFDLLLKFIPWEGAHQFRELTDVLDRETLDVYASKKRALAEGDEAVQRQIARGKDIISILMRANINASGGDQLPEHEVIGQMTTLVFAATETTSNALSRILWLLCIHRDIQERLRNELRQAMEGKDELNYNNLEALPFLEAVCREALRLYPPVASLHRVAVKDIVLPLSQPIKGIDGKVILEIPVPKGSEILVSIINCNRNPDLWGPDAHEYKPERWLKPLPDSVLVAQIPGVYGNQMTFSGGGRSCIGFKFSLLEMKVVLSLLVRKFEFDLPKSKEIGWKIGGVASPFTTEQPSVPQLPLSVKVAK
ncbi:cytochrome P450 [Crepidotus variabilis]|uniref:Cytochrome P450 n=1 Tax=Crepidotus variabilis TaxID=179855 RepID=A0A9P6JLK6_9AGAR|nr:cytochrome P450 [Crepidotus variabilis]